MMCSNVFAYAKERQNMNSVPSVGMTNNNVNFGHNVKYSPEAKAEFARQMDKYIKFASKPYTEMNLKDFLTELDNTNLSEGSLKILRK